MNKKFGNASARAMMGSNLPDRLSDIEKKLKQRPISSLRQLVDLMPDLFAMRFISPVDTTVTDPEDAAFSGSGVAGTNPVTISDVTYSIFDIINGLINFGVIPGQGFIGANGAFRVNNTGVYIGDKVVLDLNGLWAIATNILLDATQFTDLLDQSGSGGFTPWSTGANGDIYCVYKDGSGVYWIGGNFTIIGGVRSPYFVKYSGGVFSKPYPGVLDGAVRAITGIGSYIYLAGDFERLDFSTAERDLYGSGFNLGYIAKCNGTNITAMSYLTSTGANNVVRALAVNGNTLYAGGDATQWLGTSAARVVAIDVTTPTAPTASALSTGLDAACYSLLFSTDLYAGGAFTDKVRIYTGGAWAAHGTSGPNNTIYAIAKSGNDVYAVGAQTSPGNYISKCTSGGAWAAVGSGLAGVGYSVAIDGSNVIAGFNGGEYVKYWDTSNWISLGAGVNATVYSILVNATDAWILAGAYTLADGETIYRISIYSPSAAPETLHLQHGMEMLDIHEHYSPLTGHVGGTFASGAMEYTTLGRSGSGTTESDWQIYLPAGTILGFYFVTKTAQHGLGSLVATIRKDGADTALAIIVAASAGAGTKSETATELEWAGGLFDIEWVNAAGGASASVRGVTVMFKPA